MLRKILSEIILIRKELQAINRKESDSIVLKPKTKVVRQNGAMRRVPNEN